MKSAFRSSSLRQAQDNVWKGLKVSLCETVVVFELVHDDYAWQAQFFGCLRLMFRGRCGASETATNKCLIPIFAFTMTVMFRGACSIFWKCNTCSRNPVLTLRVSVRSRCGAVLVLRSLGQPSRHFGCVRSLSLWCGACFQKLV